MFRPSQKWLNDGTRSQKRITPNSNPPQRTTIAACSTDTFFLPSGRKRIDKITTSELQELLNGIPNVADSTQKRIILTMKLVFEMAIQEEYIVKNPAKAKLNRTGAETKEGRALTEADG